jgi:hypothetical protein
MLRCAILPCLLLAGGCATIVTGTSQPVAINTPGVAGVAGAVCTLSSPKIGDLTVVTPATVTLKRADHDVMVACKKECFEEGTAVIPAGVEAMAAGNILVGGVVGAGLDIYSGAINKYASGADVAMVPIKGCKARLAKS